MKGKKKKPPPRILYPMKLPFKTKLKKYFFRLTKLEECIISRLRLQETLKKVCPTKGIYYQMEILIHRKEKKKKALEMIIT